MLLVVVGLWVVYSDLSAKFQVISTSSGLIFNFQKHLKTTLHSLNLELEGVFEIMKTILQK